MQDKMFECCCEVIHEGVVNEVKLNMDSEKNYQALATLYKMFGDPTRVKILHALRQHEMCVCDLAALLGVTKSAISHQLKSLRLSNLVQNRREGQVVYYSLADAHVEMILDLGMEHINE
ncbi:ArsR/SmtB family transcription factor [Eubacterium oxidoreducens]|uniref:DNA-binding transcriptional regulator, ArsR family n=1 Tax=Eubacterium oxidoreducens TaxID=1732 RepID=A0A1G6AWH1_EUBOX|nr:metalloregulator ArsR/SmtB family transcription factor [Eubacterium oxidoreducens]SDB12674.1 DNA-binding transcriptional regulator, ArsR family [Eubacterium oxidoreducens]